VGEKEGGFFYFIETETGRVMKILFSSPNSRRPAFDAPLGLEMI
jgi:hypothetical protein